MKCVVSFYGMCLCVLEGRKGTRATKATVLLLNGAAPSAGAAASGVPLPFHHPLLFVPKRSADLKASTWSPVPAPETLVETEGLVSGANHAWSLSGLDLTLGTGRGITLFQNQPADANGRLHDLPAKHGDEVWLDWRRIPDLSRIAPGARLRASYKKIGLHVLGRIHVTGGELRGAVPKDAGALATPWHFSDGFSQVITDRFEFHCELPGNDVTAQGFAGSRGQALRLAGGAKTAVRLAIVHEATPSAKALRPVMSAKAAKTAVTRLPHYSAFYNAIQGKAVDALAAAPPHRAGPAAAVKRPVIDTPTCPPALL